MNEAWPTTDTGEGLPLGVRPPVAQKNQKSTKQKQKQKSSPRNVSIGVPTSDPTLGEFSPQVPAKQKPHGAPKRKGWKKKPGSPTKGGGKLNRSRPLQAQLLLEAADTITPSREPSKCPTTTPRKPTSRSKKQLDVEARRLSRELSKAPPAKPRNSYGTSDEANLVKVDSSTSLKNLSLAPSPTTAINAYKKQKKKMFEAIGPQTPPPMETRAAALQILPGSAGRAKIANNLAHVFKAQQTLVVRHRSRKPCATKIFPFLNLPRELRDIIISYTIDYDGINPTLVQINDSFPAKSLRSSKFPELYQGWMENLEARSFCTTPTILLLNHQIHDEALEMLQKKALRITNPPQYSMPGQFDLSRVISDGALEKVRKVKFVLRTYPAKIRMLNLLRNDWRGKDFLKRERLADSYPWALLMKDCFDVWRSTQQSRSLEISIDHCSGPRSEYNLLMNQEKVDPLLLIFTSQWLLILRQVCAFEKCIDDILLSHNLDTLMAFLTFAHVPIEFE
jgi:hypothetical protein